MARRVIPPFGRSQVARAIAAEPRRVQSRSPVTAVLGSLRRLRAWRLPALWVTCAGLLGATPLDAGAPEGPADAAVLTDAAADPEVQRLVELASAVRDLVAGKLETSREPSELFDFPISDEDAVQVARRRLSAIVTASREPSGADAGDAAPPSKRDGGVADARPEAEPLAEEDTLWRAQLELDEARLAFVSLSPAARKKLLDDHASRKQAASKADQKDDQAQQRAEQAAKDRKQALEEARLARSEAERQVAEERARLNGVQEAQAKFEATVIQDEAATAKQADDTLSWSRRVSEMVSQRANGAADSAAADRLYMELRAKLRDARAELGRVLGLLASGDSDVPGPGPDRLRTEGTGVDRSQVDALRGEVSAMADKLAVHERTARWARAKSLAERVDSMNRDRLALYSQLSPALRDSLTSFSPAGWDQARAEGYQVALVARYHAQATASWVASLRDPSQRNLGNLFATFTLLKMLGLGIVYFWWRRIAEPLLASIKARIAPEPAVVSRASAKNWAARGVSLLIRIRRPLESLLLAWALLTLAGPAVASLFEARIPWLILSWALGGLIGVYVMDELLGTGGTTSRGIEVSELRLRSFKLIGRVVVALGLTLALTRELVGRGTIHDWVLSVAWFALLPVGAILSRWWRATVFERLAGHRKKRAFDTWLLGRQGGWASLLASAVGGVYLIGIRVFKAARAYVSGFRVTRRALAYLFRREVAKQATKKVEELPAIDPSHAAVFDPDLPAEDLLENVAKGEIELITTTIDAPNGGVFALVGERGAGKTTVARRILGGRPDSLLVSCPPGGFDAFRRELVRALGLDLDASDDDITRAIDARPEDNALLVDDAHRLVRPIIGGLDDFDRALQLARASSGTCTWVFCIGAGIWQYVARARGARPVFDHVFPLARWTEEQIGELLRRRTRDVGLQVRFDGLVVEPEEDPELYAEQLARAEENFIRLLWDHASGNAAVALYYWRESLRIGEEGEIVVQLFEAPDTADLESLPDPAVFVLRAVVQLELAAFEDIVDATRLPTRQVEDALRYGSFRGYLERIDGRYRVHWRWFRSVSRFLERRHLLAKGI
jgi:hypothetical protein